MPGLKYGRAFLCPIERQGKDRVMKERMTMSEAYLYQAALLCGDCGRATREKLRPAMLAADPQFDECSEETYDSDDFPKGPYLDGGGPPEFCDMCQAALDKCSVRAGDRLGG